jgi:RHS repeat-associated protein
MQNALGNLAEAYTGTSSSKITDLYFSKAYGGSAGGAVSQVWEWTNHSGGYFLTTDAYYPNGALGLRTTSYGVPSVSYGLDGEGRPNAATDSTYGLNLVTATGTSYNTASAATGVSYGNGDSDAFGYDAMNRPNSIAYNVGGSNPMISNALTWNANSSLNSMQVTDNNDTTKNQNCTYSADDLSRIASVNCNSAWAQNFTYDAFGNIQKSGSSNYIAAYSTVTNQVSGGPSYDANGNQLTSTPANLTWNALNVPISVNSTTATYDALGRMVEKGSGGTYTQFVFSPAGTLLALYSGGLAKGTIPLPGGGTAIYNGGGLNYIRHTDSLGSSRLATTWAHAVYSKEAYAPFGETYNEAGTPDRSFTGQDQDVVTGSGGTGVYDYLFRKYDPSAGRWLSPDPAGWQAVSLHNPQSFDRYAYVENQPMSLIDPSGLWTIPCPGGGDGYVVSVGADGNYYMKHTVCDNGLPETPILCQGFGDCTQGVLGTPPGQIPEEPLGQFSLGGSSRTLPQVPPGVCTAAAAVVGGAAGATIGWWVGGIVGGGVGAVGGTALEPGGGTLLLGVAGAGGGSGLGAGIGGGIGAVLGGWEGSILCSKGGGNQNIKPSWAAGDQPKPGESASQFAKRVCDARYGPGNYPKGPGSEFNALLKWARYKFGI